MNSAVLLRAVWELGRARPRPSTPLARKSPPFQPVAVPCSVLRGLAKWQYCIRVQYNISEDAVMMRRVDCRDYGNTVPGLKPGRRAGRGSQTPRSERPRGPSESSEYTAYSLGALGW